MSLTRRLLSFGSLPLLAVIAPMLLLPLVARLAGPEGWASFASAQAVGGVASTIVMFGWSVGGQARVSLEPDWHKRVALYMSSVQSRLVISCLVIPVCLALTWALGSPADHAASLLMALAMCLNGWSPGWFSIGVGRAGWIAGYEAAPKMLATAIATIVLPLAQAIWVYPALLLVGTLLGIALFNKRVIGSWLPLGSLGQGRWRSVPDWKPAGISILGTAYASAPLPLAALITSLSATSALASIDRLYRYGLLSVSTLGNALQEWTLVGPASGHRRRLRVALMLHLGLGAVGGASLAVFGPVATGFMFGNAVQASQWSAVAYGLAFFAISTSTPLIRNVLIPMGRADAVLAATLVSAVVGLASMTGLAVTVSSRGLVAGFAASEVLCLLVLARSVMRVKPTKRSSSDVPPMASGHCSPGSEPSR